MRGRSPSPYDRRRSPMGRRDRRFPVARDRRRPRSFSPGPDRGRRSPAYKRFRRDDDYYDRYDRGSPGYRRGGYERDRYDDRDFRDSYRDPHGRGPHRRDQEPQTYKEFMMRLPDEITPEDASKKYQEYLANWYGSQIKAEFEQRKDEEWIREKYDPREVKKAIERRKDRAAEMAAKFFERLQAGELDPEAPDFNQGAKQQSPEPKEGAKEGAGSDGARPGATETKIQAPFCAPAVCWTPERMESDVLLSTELLKKLDSEKDISSNPLLELQKEGTETKTTDGGAKDGPAEDACTAEGNAAVTGARPGDVDGESKADIKMGDDEEGIGGEKGEATADPTQEPSPAEEGMSNAGKIEKAEQRKEGDDEVNGMISSKYSLEGRLDLALAYLWEVHLIDFYAGHELTEAEFASTKCRMLRPPKPEEAEARDEEMDKRMLDELHERVDKFWKERVKNGSPLERRAQILKVDKAVEDFIDSQVTRIGEKKWGNKLSTKLFVGREFVIKHIKLKHSAVVDAEREKILDEIFFTNYKRDKEEEERRMQEERRKSQAMLEGAEHAHAAPDAMHGRGSHAIGMSVRTMGNRGIIAPMVPSPMMGGPVGQVLLPAPGAGPLGPFILQPVPSGAMPPMEMGQMGMDIQRSMGASGMGGRGGNVAHVSRGWGGGFREYYDLDAPQNNRAVLDYGDL